MTSWSAAGSPSPAIERSRRLACRVSANGTPSTTLHVSKTPSPTVTPWSSAAIDGAEALTLSPFTHTLASSAGLLTSPSSLIAAPFSQSHLPRCQPDQASRLELCLSPLLGGVRRPGDRAAGAEPQPSLAARIPIRPEGSDPHGKLGLAGVRIHPAHRTAVRSPGHALQVGDHGQRGRLGRPRHRPGWEGRRDDLCPAHARAHLARDRGDQMGQARMLFWRTQGINTDGAWTAYRGEVVAHEVGD